MSLEALFCDIDDFCQVFLPQWEQEQLTHRERQRRRSSTNLPISEIMTIMAHSHQPHYRHFKGYYLGYVRRYPKEAFP